MNVERMVTSWVLLIAGWAAYGINAITDSLFAAVVALVLFVGAIYGFISSILEG